MPLQIVNITDSKVKFVNEESDPVQMLANENADLLFQNAMQDFQLQTLTDENAELLFRVANLELGGLL